MNETQVYKGEKHEVEIYALGEKGDGLAKINGNFIVIVPGTEVGQKCTIRLTNVLRRYAFGEVIEE